MGKKARLIMTLVLIMVLSSVLAACSIGKKEAQLRVLMGLGEEEWKVIREEIIPEFEKKHNVKVQAVQADSAGVADKLDAQIKAKKVEIDLITQDVNDLYTLVSKGLVEDLSEHKSIIPSQVIQGMIDVSMFDGKLMFLPYRPNVEITFYNENKFKEAGLEVPKTWDELLAVAKAFKEKDGVGRVAIKGNLEGDNTLHIFNFIRGAGGDPYVLNDAGSIQAFEFMQELYPYLSPDTKTANWNFMNQHIASESVHLGQNWPFGINVIVQDGGKKEVKAYGGWSGPVKNSLALGGEVIGIPKGSPNKDLAIEFAKYLMSKEVQEVLVSKLAWPSVRGDAYGKVEEWQQPYFEAISDALENTEPRGNVPYWPEAEKAILDAFKDIVVDGKDVKSTLDQYAAKIKEAKG